MALYKAISKGYDGAKIREVGEVFEFDDQRLVEVIKRDKDGLEVSRSKEKIKPGKWMERLESKDEAALKAARGKKTVGEDLRSQNDANALAAQQHRQDVI